jgi:hypothetical protein
MTGKCISAFLTVYSKQYQKLDSHAMYSIKYSDILFKCNLLCHRKDVENVKIIHTSSIERDFHRNEISSVEYFIHYRVRSEVKYHEDVSYTKLRTMP